jgi:hypothetical protein
VLLAALVVAACNGAATPVTTADSAALLVWDSATAQLAWYGAGASQPDQTPAPLQTGQPGDRGLLCAERASDGAFVVYIGGQVGTLSLIARDTAGKYGLPAQALGPGSALSCDLGGLTTFNADGTVVASLVYPADAAFGTESAAGTLHLWAVPTTSAASSAPRLIGTVPDINGYALYGTGSAGYALKILDEGRTARIVAWPDTGPSEAAPVRDLVQFSASAGACTLVSGRVLRLGGALYAGIGERCAGSAGYQAYVLRMLLTETGIAVSSSPAPIAAPLQVGGRFYPGANTHRLLLLADGQHILWMVPDGKRIDTADLYLLDPSATTAEMLTRQFSNVVTDSSPAPGQSRFTFNLDGTQLAFVSRAINNGDSLYLWRTADPRTEPEQVNDTIRASVIKGLAWDRTGRRLLYIRGGADPGLSYIDAGGERGDQQRGDFTQALLGSGGSSAYAVMGSGPGYAIVRITLPAGEPQTIRTGFSAAPTILAVR